MKTTKKHKNSKSLAKILVTTPQLSFSYTQFPKEVNWQRLKVFRPTVGLGFKTEVFLLLLIAVRVSIVEKVPKQ